MTATARIIAEIPLVAGQGKRTVAVDDAGTGHIFTTRPFADEPEEKPRNSFRASEAVQLARDVLAGNERVVTASWPAHVLAAAVLILSEGAAEQPEEAGR